MFCVELMKNFLLADSIKPMAVRLISDSWAKNLWFLLSRDDVRRVHEKFFPRRFDRADGCWPHFGLLSPKTFDSHILDMMYVEFMKHFHLACWNKLMAIRHISPSWAQKRLIPSFYTCSASSWWKIFFLPIRTSQWLLDSFRPPEPKTFDSYFLDTMYVEFMKNFSLGDSSELMAVKLISASWA